MNKYNTADPILYPVLKEKAKHMKAYPTEAERCFWQLVRNKQLGVLFRRQYIIDQYIVDFVCLSKQLIVELDGKYHDDPEQIVQDQGRELRLQRLGFRIIRFKNEEILLSPDNIIDKLKQKLNTND